MIYEAKRSKPLTRQIEERQEDRSTTAGLPAEHETTLRSRALMTSSAPQCNLVQSSSTSMHRDQCWSNTRREDLLSARVFSTASPAGLGHFVADAVMQHARHGTNARTWALFSSKHFCKI